MMLSFKKLSNQEELFNEIVNIIFNISDFLLWKPDKLTPLRIPLSTLTKITIFLFCYS